MVKGDNREILNIVDAFPQLSDEALIFLHELDHLKKVCVMYSIELNSREETE